MVTLYFNGTGDIREGEIKSAVFLTRNNEPVRVFREIEHLDGNNDGTFQMVWKRCYIFDNDGNKLYLEHETSGRLNDMRFSGFQTDRKHKIEIKKVSTDINVLYLAA